MLLAASALTPSLLSLLYGLFRMTSTQHATSTTPQCHLCLEGSVQREEPHFPWLLSTITPRLSSDAHTWGHKTTVTSTAPLTWFKELTRYVFQGWDSVPQTRAEREAEPPGHRQWVWMEHWMWESRQRWPKHLPQPSPRPMLKLIPTGPLLGAQRPKWPHSPERNNAFCQNGLIITRHHLCWIG